MEIINLFHINYINSHYKILVFTSKFKFIKDFFKEKTCQISVSQEQGSKEMMLEIKTVLLTQKTSSLTFLAIAVNAIANIVKTSLGP